MNKLDTNWDYDLLKYAQEYGDSLRTNYAERNKQMDEYEAMVKLKWAEEKDLKARLPHLYITKSPDPRDAVEGVIRLLVASDPVFHVLSEIEGEENKQLSSQIERMAKAAWLAAGRSRSDPVHYDVVRSAVIFDEIAIGVNNVLDMIEYFDGEERELYEELSRYSPIIYDVYDPRKGYPDWDLAGLKAYYREYVMYGHEIESNWGDYGREALGNYWNKKNSKNPTKQKEGYGKYEKFTVSDLYLRKSRTVWLTGSDNIIKQNDLPYGRIPVIATLVQGSRMFSKPEDQREAFLYTLRESGLWKRQNLSLTGLYSNISQIGLQPLLLYTPGLDAEEYPDINSDGPISLIVKPKGSELTPWVQKGLIDDSVYQGLQIAERKGQEATIYPQALGAPLAGQVAYSTYALLGASGRTPLVQLQRKCSWAIADATIMGLRMMRIKGGDYSAKAGTIYAQISGNDIPEHIELQAELEMALPQDQLQSANAASILSDKQLVSKRWNRENLLQIEDSEAMDDEIMTEQAEMIAFMEYVKTRILQLQQQVQQQQQQSNQGGLVGLPGVMATGGQTMAEPGIAGATPDEAMAAGNGVEGGASGGMEAMG